jgi:hypothetical protein
MFDLDQLWEDPQAGAKTQAQDLMTLPISIVPAQRPPLENAARIDRRRRAAVHLDPLPPEKLEALLAQKESKRCKTTRVSPTAPYFPELDVPLSLISENKWSIIGAVAGTMKRAHVPKDMLRMFRDHSESIKDYENLMALVRRWIKTS